MVADSGIGGAPKCLNSQLPPMCMEAVDVHVQELKTFPILHHLQEVRVGVPLTRLHKADRSCGKYVLACTYHTAVYIVIRSKP